MSVLTPEEVAQFSLIVKRDYGVVLPSEQLTDEAQRFVDIAYAILYHKISKTS